MDGRMDGWGMGEERHERGQTEDCLGILGPLGDLLSPAPAPGPLLTAATRLFSVMKVTASSGSVSEARVATLRERARCQPRRPLVLGAGADPHSGDPYSRHLLFSICQAHGAVVADPGHTAAAGREADAVHPAAATAGLEHPLPKRHLGAPRGGCWPLLHLLDVGREDPARRGRKGGGWASGRDPRRDPHLPNWPGEARAPC